MTTNGLPSVEIVAIVYLALALISLFIVFRVVRAILRKLVDVWSKGTVFGTDQKTKLISLGIVALLFPGIFVGIGNALISLIGNFFVDLPRGLISNWQNVQAFCTGYVDIGFCTAQLGYGFVQEWTSAISDALNSFGPTAISYGRLVLMLAVWAGVSMLLSATTSEEKKEGAEQSTRLQAWFRDLKSPMRENLIFFLVLIVAGYLSIAAITAIPGLEESAVPSENVSLETLQRGLDITRKQYVDRIPANIDFSESSAPTPTATPLTTTPLAGAAGGEAIPASTEKVNDELMIRRRESWQGQYSSFLETSKSEAEKSITDALSSYQASLIGRKGVQETVQHFLALEAWFRDGLSRMEQQMSRCRRFTKALDNFYVSLPANQQLEFFPSDYSSLQQLQQNQSNACLPRSFFGPMPARQELGSNLGPFSYIARWLLRTESLSLAQIVGLLGFGLLGSAVSSLVRSKEKRSATQPLVNELATVIIRGATAAVVVFLAVKGGLAIFTSGESNPNSYVLLLTCLIAAVFSEYVWEEAQSRFHNEVRGQTNSTPTATASQETTGAVLEQSQEDPSEEPPASG